MRIKTKLTLAASFVGVVAMAAAAFGQAGSDSGSGDEKQADRRAAAARDGDGCGGPGDRAGRRPFRLVHSESKVKTPEGFALLTVDQGKVTAVDHSDKKITIERADGEKVTATAVDETNICKDGKKAAFDSIKVGDLARLMSVRSERFTGLRRIAIHTPGSEPAAPERPNRPAAPEGSSDQQSG
ncbi:MAG: hypothetical protein ACRDKG_10680 [Actinomycetota bacterium]